MRRIFIDTAHLLAILSPRDNLHGAALAATADLTAEGDVQFVTTHLVLSELLAALSIGGSYVRIRAADFVADFLNQSEVSVLELSGELFARGLQFYRSRPDKSYSLADCVSMIVCRDLEITDVLTADHDFEQEGFNILLRRRT